MQCPKAVMFDLDGTLAHALVPPTSGITARLEKLLEILPVAIISAASFKRINDRVLPHLPQSCDTSRLYIFPDTSSQCFTCKNQVWVSVYRETLTENEKATISGAIRNGISALAAFSDGTKINVDVRDSQVTIAALDIDAPVEEKKLWDPDQTKRTELKRYLESRIPGFDISIGGWRSLDITRSGLDKAHGVSWLAKELGIDPCDMLFIGDALAPGGNDFPVIQTGIQTIQVSGPEETEKIIDELLVSCGSKNAQ